MKKKLSNIMPRVLHEGLINRVILVDECCNNEKIAILVDELYKDRMVSSVFHAWQKAMITPNGDWYFLSGALPKENSDRGDKQVKGYSWPDNYVADLVMAHTISSDVIFISENTKNDVNGVRRLLREKSVNIENDFKLTAIYKNGKTSYEEFCTRAKNVVKNMNQSGSFFEHIL